MKNKKLLLVIGAVLLLILVGGVSYMKFKGGRDSDSDTKGTTESKNVFSSVKDALSKKLTLVCDFKDEKGMSTKSYIKNGAVRVSTTDGTSLSQSAEIIIKDKKMYMWDAKTKQGFVYEVPDEEGNSQVGTTNNDINKSDAYLSMIDKYKDSCKVSTVEDSYFSAPSDVKFQDMSKLLEEMKKQAPQMPQQ